VNYLLDTCIPSEVPKPEPYPLVLAWLEAQSEEALFRSALTIGELQRGLARLPKSHKKEMLSQWLVEGLLPRFRGRILPLDEQVALRWGDLTAASQAAGRPLPAIDSLIAATALVHRLTIVTRNVDDMEPSGVSVLNPWTVVGSK